MKKVVTLGLIQMSCSESVDENVAKAEQKIRAAAESGAQIVCTQELYKSPYFCQVENADHYDLAEVIDENCQTTRDLGKLASELEIVLIASLFEKRAPGIYHNTAVIFDADGSFLGKYRKMHIPDDPHYYEKYYFTPGDLGYQVFDTKFGRIGILICWDQWFPETGRILALNGAEIILFPSAIGRSYHGSDAWTWERMRDEWILVNRAQAAMNEVYLGALNRVGKEKEMEFFGNSFICNPVGEIIKKGGDKQEIITASLDASLFDEVRRLWPFFRDRRSEIYKKIIG